MVGMKGLKSYSNDDVFLLAIRCMTELDNRELNFFNMLTEKYKELKEEEERGKENV